MYFYYGPNSIEIVETYKYLGIVFHYSGKFSQVMTNLADKNKKVSIAIICQLNSGLNSIIQ